MKPNYLRQIAVAACVLGLATTAMAQYVWLDEKGVKQYSDQPPPSSVPKKRILKEPSGMAAAPEPTATDDTSTTPEKAKPLTTAEKNIEFQKRQAEQAEKEKKAAEQAKQASDKAANCERARAYNRTLESGVRITRTDKNGEQSFLTDEQRAQETRDAKRALSECK